MQAMVALMLRSLLGCLGKGVSLSYRLSGVSFPRSDYTIGLKRWKRCAVGSGELDQQANKSLYIKVAINKLGADSPAFEVSLRCCHLDIPPSDGEHQPYPDPKTSWAVASIMRLMMSPFPAHYTESPHEAPAQPLLNFVASILHLRGSPFPPHYAEFAHPCCLYGFHSSHLTTNLIARQRP